MKRAYALVVLALASTAASACGGGEAMTAGSKSTVVIAVNPELGNDLGFRTKSASARAGDVKVVLRNPQLGVEHDLRVEDAEGNQLGATEVITEGSDSFTLEDLESGEYFYFCSVPGHRPAGMEGTLTVE
ncbi:MAG: cupredoxin domain-containing protein [Thermoleophilaceae bacterium]